MNQLGSLRLTGKTFLTTTAAFILLYLYYITGGVVPTALHQHTDGSATVVFLSLLPLNAEQLAAQLSVASTDPRQKVTWNITSRGRHTYELTFREHNLPLGSPVLVSMQLPTLLPKTHWVKTKQISGRPTPQVVSGPSGLVGTTSPLELRFNSSVSSDSLQRALTADFDFTASPKEVTIDGKPFIDTSAWLITPTQPLRHDTQYRIQLADTLKSTGGITLDKAVRWQVTTVPKLELVSVAPADQATGLSLETPVRVEANRELTDCRISVDGQAHLAMLQGETAIFIPKRLLLPDTKYEIEIQATDTYGESVAETVSFATESMGDRIWVEVSLWEPHSVRVFQGKALLKEMIASGGKDTSPTPFGRYRINGRGYAFFSQRYNEGAYYWVRFLGNYLFHSVPFGPDGKFLPEEIRKIGSPASHGCVRLPLNDAKWVYRNVPERALVIIHGPPRSLSSISLEDDRIIFMDDQQTLERFVKGGNLH